MAPPLWFDQLAQDARYAESVRAKRGVRAHRCAFARRRHRRRHLGFQRRECSVVAHPGRRYGSARLVDISSTDSDDSFGINQISFPNFVDLRERATMLENLYAYKTGRRTVILSGADGVQRILGHRVTTSYFDVLGLRPAAGCLFDTRLSEQPAAEQTEAHAAELRYAVWSMNSNLQILTAQTLEEAAALALLPHRLSTAVSGGLGVVGLLLAALGIYGITAYAVGCRATYARDWRSRRVGGQCPQSSEPWCPPSACGSSAAA